MALVEQDNNHNDRERGDGDQNVICVGKNNNLFVLGSLLFVDGMHIEKSVIQPFIPKYKKAPYMRDDKNLQGMGYGK